MNQTKTFRVPQSKCTSCNTIIDAATGVKGEGNPEEGSFTICYKCGNVMVFDKDLRLHTATDKELEELMKQSPEAFNAVMAAIMVIKAYLKQN